MLTCLALPYAHMPPIFTFTTLPIKPDCTTATAMQYDLVWLIFSPTCTQHYYRHSIILVICYRHSTQSPHFTAPFMYFFFSIIIYCVGGLCPMIHIYWRPELKSTRPYFLLLLPAMWRMSGPVCPPPFLVHPFLKRRLSDSVGNRFVVM